jgi:zinc protease
MMNVMTQELSQVKSEMSKGLRGLGVSLVAMTCALTPARAADPHWSSGTERVVLENGLTVLLLRRGDLPIVSVQALYRVGSRNEWPGVTGGAHYLEHMAFRSTDGIAKEDLTNQVLRWGGRWNGYTSYDQTVYGSHAPSVHLDWLLLLERERMTRVRFAPDEVERERTSVIAELRQYENSPSYVLSEHRLRRAALVAHPYGSPIMGWLSDLQSVTPADLERFYRDFYAPNNLILAIVGQFDRQNALSLVRKHFGALPGNGRSTKIRTTEPSQHGLRRVTTTGPGSSVYVEATVHAPAASDEAFATLLVLDGVLAGGKAPGRGTARPGSRLHRALVETGLAYSVTTDVEASEYPGLYSVGVTAAAGADPGRIESAIFAALDAVGQEITPAEMTASQAQVVAALTFAADSNRAMANLLSVYEELGSFTLLEEIPRRVAAQTARQVAMFAGARLALRRRSVGVFTPGPAAAGPERLEPSLDVPESGVVPRLPSQVPPPVAPLEVPFFPSPEMLRLSNGLAVSVLPMSGQVVHLRIRIAAASVDEPHGLDGVALLTARLLQAGTRGPATPPTRALASQNVRLLQSAYGDDDDPAANRNYVEIAATMLAGQLERVAPLLADLVMQPVFPEDAFTRAVADLGNARSAHGDDSEWRAGMAAWERLFPPEHPYGRAPQGTSASLARIRREDVLAFHRLHYRPERIVVAVAGGVEPGARQMLERAFSRRPPAPAAMPAGLDVVAPVSPREGGRVQVSMPHKEQASIAVLLPGVARRDPDYVALVALNYLLGETGYAGRLGEVLVDTGLSYSVYASVLADRGPGPVSVSTNAVNSQEAVRRILAVLDRFARGGVTDAHVREAQGFLLGRLLFRFETPAAATETMAGLLIAGDEGDLNQFATRVLRLTAPELSKIAARYYDPSRAVVAVAGR